MHGERENISDPGGIRSIERTLKQRSFTVNFPVTSVIGLTPTVISGSQYPLKIYYNLLNLLLYNSG